MPNTPSNRPRPPPSSTSRQQVFTAEQRERQAAGKDPYADSDGDQGDRDSLSREWKPGQGLNTESYADKERRGFAISVLENPDQLMTFALSTGDSVPGQRLRFMSMLCGFKEPEPSRKRQQAHRSTDRMDTSR